jgi:predicted outer membrane repeat protein
MRSFEISLLLGVLLAAAVPSSPARAGEKGLVILPTVYRVGASGAPCTHATLAAALTAAPAQGETIIRLADNQLYTGINVNIAARNVTIVGGYANCAATASGGDRTVLTGAPAAADSVIEVDSGSDRRTVVLRHLEIRGGTPDADGGGGLQVQGDTGLTLENVRFEDNGSTDGGAIRLLGTALDPVELRVPLGGATGTVEIAGNSASGDGGGIHCAGADIRVDGTLLLSSNTAAPATGSGGGALLADCALLVGQAGADSAELSFNHNDAGSGGGFYAEGGSSVLLRGARADFVDNRARTSGGGMVVTGAGTTLAASSLYMSFNHVLTDGGSPSGGAIRIGNGAEVTISQELEPCRTLAIGPTRACNTIRDSYVESTFGFGFGATGGAIAVDESDGTRLTLAQTYLGNNRFVPNGGPTAGAAIYAGDISASETSRVELESVIFDNNTGADEEVRLDDGVDAEFLFTSFNATPGLVAAIGARSGAALELHATVSLADTLIDTSDGGIVAGSCNFLLPGDDSFASVGSTALVDFVDAANGDLRPSAGATMIDRCSDEQFAPQFRDAFDRARPVDVPERPNVPGPFDAGAYEFNPDPVFADGFEGM